MDACLACGTKVEDGLTKCPQCGANLTRSGAFLLVIGWVMTFASLIPLVVGVVTAEQRSYKALAFGLVMLIVGVVMVIIGRIRIAQSPTTTKPMPKIENPMVGTNPEQGAN